jgi:hypothetical protein
MRSASVLSGFSMKVQRAEARRADGRVDGRVPAHHEHRRIELGRAHVRQKRQAVAVGEGHVEEAQVVAPLLELLFRDSDSACNVHRVPFEGERLLEGREDRGFVVDDEKMSARHPQSLADRAGESTLAGLVAS